MAEDYPTNLLRVCAAHLQLQTSLLVAKEMHGKSYFALGGLEKIGVDQAAYGLLQHYFQSITQEYFVGTQQSPGMGFLAGMSAAPTPPAQPSTAPPNRADADKGGSKS